MKRMKHLGVMVVGLLVVGSLLADALVYQVDSYQVSLLKTFGRTGEPIYGKDGAGLRLKWPWPIQRVVTYNDRIYLLEDTNAELQTQDKFNVILGMYCSWRIADPVLFNATADTVKGGEDRLRSLMSKYKGDVVGHHPMSDFVNTDPSAMKLKPIEEDIQTQLTAQARRDYGIEIVRVGITSMTLPKTVTEAVIEAQKQERRAAIDMYHAKGDAEATAIRSRAELAQKQILAFTQRKADIIKSEGAKLAAQAYTAFEADPELSMFLRTVESLQKQLSGRTVILLDSSVLPGLDFWTSGPHVDKLLPGAAITPATHPADKPK